MKVVLLFFIIGLLVVSDYVVDANDNCICKEDEFPEAFVSGIVKDERTLLQNQIRDIAVQNSFGMGNWKVNSEKTVVYPPTLRSCFKIPSKDEEVEVAVTRKLISYVPTICLNDNSEYIQALKSCVCVPDEVYGTRITQKYHIRVEVVENKLGESLKVRLLEEACPSNSILTKEAVIDIPYNLDICYALLLKKDSKAILHGDLVDGVFQIYKCGVNEDASWLNVKSRCQTCSQCPSVGDTIFQTDHTISGLVEDLNFKLIEWEAKVKVENRCPGATNDEYITLDIPLIACDNIVKGGRYVFHYNVGRNIFGELRSKAISCGVRSINSWDVVDGICNSCERCLKLEVDYNNGIITSSSDVPIQFSSTVEGYITSLEADIASIYITNKCESTADITSSTMTVRIPQDTCNYRQLYNSVNKEDNRFLFHMTLEADAYTIVRCGVIDTYQWSDEDKKCNPCKLCPDTIQYNYSDRLVVYDNGESTEGIITFEGRVSEQTDNGFIIEVTETCESSLPLLSLSERHIQIAMLRTECNYYELLRAIGTEKRFLFHTTAEMIQTDNTIVRVVKCGVLSNYQWEVINPLCNPCKDCLQSVSVDYVNRELTIGKLPPISEILTLEGSILQFEDGVALISISNRCESMEDYTDDNIAIFIPIQSCNYYELAQNVLTGNNFLFHLNQEISGDEITTYTAVKCGVVNQYFWSEVEAQCLPCKNCRDVVVDYSKRILVINKEHIIQDIISFEGVILSKTDEGFMVGITGSCESSSLLSKEDLIIVISREDCMYRQLLEAVETQTRFMMHGVLDTSNGNKVVIVKCGVLSNYQWEVINPLCNPCKDCLQSVSVDYVNRELTIGKLPPISEILTLEGSVLEFTEGVAIIQITNRCESMLEYAEDTIDIYISPDSCNYYEILQSIEKETKFLFYLTQQISEERITTYTAVKCGVVNQYSWSEVEAQCLPCKICKDVVINYPERTITIGDEPSIQNIFTFEGTVVKISDNIATVTISGACDQDIENGSNMEVIISREACNYRQLMLGAGIELKKFLFHAINEDGEFHAVRCGVLTEYVWNDVFELCGPCRQCKSISMDYPRMTLQLADSIPRENIITIEGNIVNFITESQMLVEVVNKCEANFMNLEGMQIVSISKSVCDYKELKEGTTALFHLVNGVGGLEVVNCGIITDYSWEEIDELCNPCKTCKSLEENLLEEKVVFSGQIVDHSVDAASRFEELEVIISKSCNSILSSNEHVTIRIPRSSCNYMKIIDDKTREYLFTVLPTSDENIFNTDRCGIHIDFNWDEVSKLCNACTYCNTVSVESIINEQILNFEGEIVGWEESGDPTFAIARVVPARLCEATSGIDSEVKIYISKLLCKYKELESIIDVKAWFNVEKMYSTENEFKATTCGVQLEYDWNNIDKICNSCVPCKDDRALLLSEEVSTIEGIVNEVVSDERGQIARVSISRRCMDATSIEDSVDIVIPRETCKYFDVKISTEPYLFHVIRNNQEIVVSNCGIKLPGEFEWNEIISICNSCETCTSEALTQRLQENKVMFGATVTNIEEEDDRRILTVVPHKACTEAVPIDTPLTFEVAHQTCHVNRLKEGNNYYFFGNIINEAFTIGNCGIESDVSTIPPYNCDVCPQCRSITLSSRIQESDYIVYGSISGLGFENRFKDGYIEIEVKMLNIYSGDTSKIHRWPILLKKPCNDLTLRTGKEYTFFMRVELINKYEFLVIDRCGISDALPWEEVVELSNEASCPIVIHQTNGQQCVCKKLLRPVCAMDDLGALKTYNNACEAKCHKTKILCESECDRCKMFCRYE